MGRESSNPCRGSPVPYVMLIYYIYHEFDMCKCPCGLICSGAKVSAFHEIYYLEAPISLSSGVLSAVSILDIGREVFSGSTPLGQDLAALRSNSNLEAILLYWLISLSMIRKASKVGVCIQTEDDI